MNLLYLFYFITAQAEVQYNKMRDNDNRVMNIIYMYIHIL